MIGRSIDQYQIVEKIGEGGMGAVYKALDRKLNRHVALKFLSSRLFESDLEAARLEQEAKAISALNHPHIAAIHELGEFEGRPYLVLEYLPGGTLGERLRGPNGKSGLAEEELLRFALEAAEGLAHAHLRGVIHRDVKTDNMMFTERGAVKITDFGLALKASGHDTGEDTVKGTAAYMSPEQGQGFEVDERSDVFSFGIVLYELACGDIPFPGSHPAAIAYDILHTPTPSILERRPDLPPELDRIVQRATAKEADQRYNSMAHLADELRRLYEQSLSGVSEFVEAPAQAPPQNRRWVVAALAVALAAVSIWIWRGPPPPARSGPISIAVLPFQDISGGAEQDAVSAEITAALVAGLERMPTVRVVPSASLRPDADRTKTLRELAAAAGVQSVVDGSVRRVRDRLRVSVQLIDARSDANLWAGGYEAAASDIVGLQRQVVQAAASAVEQLLSQSDRSPRP